MNRPPSINPQRDKEVARLKRLLAELDAIPPQRRDAEHADERTETVHALLKDALKR